MHTEYGFIKFVGTFCELSFNIVKIRDRFRIIIFHCVGIEAYKFHTSGYERKVCIAEYLPECIFSGSQTIMVSDKSHIRHMKSVHDIPLPKKFIGKSEVTEVASMNYKVDVVSFVDSVYKVNGFVIPALRVTHGDKAYSRLSQAFGLDLLNIFRINVSFSFYVDVIWMIIYQVTSGN